MYNLKNIKSLIKNNTIITNKKQGNETFTICSASSSYYECFHLLICQLFKKSLKSSFRKNDSTGWNGSAAIAITVTMFSYFPSFFFQPSGLIVLIEMHIYPHCINNCVEVNSTRAGRKLNRRHGAIQAIHNLKRPINK